MASILAFILETFPTPLLTRDQIRLLKVNNISSQGLETLKTEIRNPTSLQSVIDSYI